MTDATPEDGRRAMPLSIALWIIAALLSALYVFAGTPKVLGSSQTVLNFRVWGYPDGFRILVGVLEVAGGVGLLIPRLTTWAASGLVCIMLGAIYTHISTATPGAVVPVVAILALGGLAYARRKEALFLAGSGSSAPAAPIPPPSES